MKGEELEDDLLKFIDEQIKNAHYWMTEADAIKQSGPAMLAARGAVLRLSEVIQSARMYRRMESSSKPNQ